MVGPYHLTDRWMKHFSKHLWDPVNKTGWLLLFLGPESKPHKWLVVANKKTW